MPQGVLSRPASELLVVGLELLHILRQCKQLPGKGIDLLEHGFGSASLQLGQKRLCLSPQPVNILLVTLPLLVQTLHLGQTLLNGGFVIRRRLQRNFCCNGVIHSVYLHIQYNTRQQT